MFGGEAFDGRDAAQVVGEAAGQVAHLFAHIGVNRSGLALEIIGAPDDHRHRCKSQYGNQWRNHEEYGTDRNDGYQYLNHCVGTAIQEALKLIDVVIHGGDQLAGAA